MYITRAPIDSTICNQISFRCSNNALIARGTHGAEQMEERCAYISESKALQEQFRNHEKLKKVSLITLDMVN